MSYTVDNIALTITVNTIHNQDTEFVLDQAIERNNKPVCFYYDQLVASISEAIQEKTWRVEGYQVHYYFTIEISISDLSDYESLLSIVNRCIVNWKNKYNIDKMLNLDKV